MTRRRLRDQYKGTTFGMASSGEQDLKALYLIEWQNPYPGEEIVSIDFISQGKAIPVLVAITGER